MKDRGAKAAPTFAPTFKKPEKKADDSALQNDFGMLLVPGYG
jgi:hypothetical protein